jgi:hypothetical protein
MQLRGPFFSKAGCLAISLGMLFSIPLLFLTPVLADLANFEAPAEGSVESGIGLVRGWACTVADKVEVQIDGQERQRVAYGTSRLDTASVCAGKTNTGFGVTVNWNEYEAGAHEIGLFIDNQLIASRTFTVAPRLIKDEPNPKGLTKKATIANFPDGTTTVELEWQEAIQNFHVRNVKQLLIFPTSLTFGPIKIGEEVRLSFQITNRTIQDMNYGVTTESGGFSIVDVETGETGGGATSGTLFAQGQQEIELVFRPTHEGMFPGTISIFSSVENEDGSVDNFSGTVTVTGEGSFTTACGDPVLQKCYPPGESEGCRQPLCFTFPCPIAVCNEDCSECNLELNLLE